VKRATKGKGFVEKHKPIHKSNVMYYLESQKIPTRVKISVDEKFKKQRVTVKFNEVISK
jgi:ribosomal protein L24